MSADFQKIRSEHSLVDVVSRYVELLRRGKELAGLCPFHNDSKPSLTIYNGSDGFQRYRCFSCGAGSEGGDVIDFISAIEGVDTIEACKRLTGKDLPEIGTFSPPQAPPPDESKSWRPIVPVPDDAPEYDPAKTYNPRRGRLVFYRPTRIDPYYDADGLLLCYVVRLDFSDGTKICPTVTYCVGPGGEHHWTVKRMPPPYPLHGLDDLKRRPSDCVLLVSGEKCRQKCADRMKGFVVVSWLGGDQTIDSVDIAPLIGRYIVYAPDADPSSKRSMIAMHNRIEKAGTG